LSSYKGAYKDTQGNDASIVITWDISNVDKPISITPPK